MTPSTADDDAWDEGDDVEDSDDEPTVPCPFCRREIFEDSPCCPACGRYLSEADRAGSGRPAWVIVTAILCLGLAIWWAISR